ncbi:MAG: hypothetical protein DCC68_06895 [Planctomycetota bacterium]|nr:MAG: hypothetical protein DCC68_06895 [Planctomycetota bacterium]
MAEFEWNPDIHAELLWNARLSEGLSRAKAAEQLKVSPLTVFNWENKKSSPQAANLKAIVSVFGEEAFNPETAQQPDGEGNLSLATWVFQKRSDNGWSRRQLANLSDVSQMTIWNIESGRTLNPQASTIERLENAFKEQVPEDLSADITDAADLEVADIGPFTEFDPHDEKDLPTVPGIYVFYDISDRAVYVGKAEIIAKRIRDPHTGHWDKFWYRPPIVQSGAYVRIDDETLRGQIEAVMIKFMKSNAVINKQGVIR